MRAVARAVATFAVGLAGGYLASKAWVEAP
jgi:hypothetical protein